MAGAQADWESQAFARQHTPYPGAGSYGITHMRPCGADGKPLSEEQRNGYRLNYGGRKYPLGAHGEVTFCDSAAFMPAVKERLETEHYLHQLSTWILGGNRIFEQIFPGILAYCLPDKTGKDMPINGHMIPASLA